MKLLKVSKITKDSGNNAKYNLNKLYVDKKKFKRKEDSCDSYTGYF